MTLADTARLVAILGDLNRAEQAANRASGGADFADWRAIADALPEYDADLSSHLDEGDPVAFALEDGTVIAWDDRVTAWQVVGDMPSLTIRRISLLDLNGNPYAEQVNRLALEQAADDADRLDFLRPADRG